MVRIVAGEEGARLVLYTGRPQRDPIVSHGPFIGDSKDDIAALQRVSCRALRTDEPSRTREVANAEVGPSHPGVILEFGS